MSAPKHETLRLDVTDAVGTGEQLSVVATVALPDVIEPAQPMTVFVGYPGGGYNRHYYDLAIEHTGVTRPYSQSAHHVARGAIFVGIDHLGVGDSDVPTRAVDYPTVARANTRAAAAIVSRLQEGTVADRIDPITVRAVVGMGQSFGGFLLTLAQAAEPFFDAVAFLGWSAIRTDPGWPKGTDSETLTRLGIRGDDPANPRRRVYHWPDVPESIVTADLDRAPGVAGSAEMWGSPGYPGGPAVIRDRNPVHAGVVAEEAAGISVPVFIGAGEIDVMADPWAEPAAYRGSRDVTLHVSERMGHMHNFASTRTLLWDRLHAWGMSIGAKSNR